MFLAGRTPALETSDADFAAIVRRLERVGYTAHKGPRIQRLREIGAWRLEFPAEDGQLRQIHVQCMREVDRKGRQHLAWYAHTEPAGWGLRHLWAALTDRVSYQHGARMLREQLAGLRLARAA